MHAKISQLKEQVKEIIVSIPVESLRRVIGKIEPLHLNSIVAKRRMFEK